MPRQRSVAQIESDAEALELRRRGMTYRQIAAAKGWASQKSAWEAVQRSLNDSILEPADDVRRVELDRLDEWQRLALKVLATPHFVVSQKGDLVEGPDGKPLVDDSPVLGAIDRLLKISERRARLLGLDAPAKTRVEVITEDAVEAEIRRLEAEVEAHNRAVDGRQALVLPAGSVVNVEDEEDEEEAVVVRPSG